MSSETQNFTVWGFIKGFGKLLIGLLLLLQGVIGLFVLIIVLGLIGAAMNGVSGGKDAVKVPEGAALVLNPNGVLVEQAEAVDPFEQAIEEAYGVDEPGDIEVHDLVRVIREAKTDDRIKAIVLNLGGLAVPSSSASKLHYLAAELDAFKAAGKEIVAVGDFYSQEQYLLAARADKVVMNDFGNVVLLGYGRYGTYLKSFLEKLKITSHVFRVGTFKSAVEPFLRDDMSEEAKAANRAYLNVLWDAYASSVETARGLPAGSVKRYADEAPDLLRASGGDFGEMAMAYGLVDELQSRNQTRAMLKEMFGADKSGKSFKKIGYEKYLEAVGEPEDGDDPNIAIVTAAGAIIDGEADAGDNAGGDTIAKYLKKALDDDDVKAVVLRVDSPGGSAFASEVIRDGVLALKAAGKPVVVSMGSLAASGGYWISAPADEIWAAPTTITGSIGIFGFFTTFEQLAAEWGVNVDGVGTTSLAPFMATGLGPLPETGADIIQQSIEDGYDDFLTVVSEGRDLEKSYVDEIGQGRVWIGSTAKDLKLVDNIGGFDEAVAAAARLANLEKYDQVELIDRTTPFEKLFSTSSARVLKAVGAPKSLALSHRSSLGKLAEAAEKQIAFFDEFNDPNASYARCMECGQ
ncbi:MAG: signal peptide peptidase SppA [Pseudomonadota bacterium]